MRIALIKLGALGDVVRTTAVLPALHKKYANLDLTWITGPSAFELVDGISYINRTVLISDNESAWAKDHYDLVISLDDEHEACALASELNADKIFGAYLSNDGKRVYSEDSGEWFGMGILRPEEDGGLERANQLKVENSSSHPEIFYRMLDLPLPLEKPIIPISPLHTNYAVEWLNKRSATHHSWIGINTGAGARWALKSFSIEKTVELVQKLAQNTDTGILILGGRDEQERNQEIVEKAERSNVYLGPNDWSLLQFSALIAQCNFLVTSDSLAQHIALATNVTLVSFFGPTSAAEIDLYATGTKIVSPIDCVCCYKKRCDLKPNCMDLISTEDIIDIYNKSIK